MSKRLAIVTGAAGDIGRAISQRLLRDHDAVVLADLNLSAAEAAAEEMQGEAIPLQVDVTANESCKDLAEIVAGAGKAVTLVNNAGAAIGPSLHATTPDHWQDDLSLNLSAPYQVFAAFADQLVASQGSVVNIASVNGMSVFGHPAYSAAKAGMIHLTRMIAVEYGRHGLRANAVAPGTVRTQAWEARAKANPAVFEEAARHYALGRIVQPDDVAEAVGFLASPLAGGITGVVLPVDCGLTAGIPALARQFSQSEDY